MHMEALRREDGVESLYAAIGAFLDAHGVSPDPAHYSFAHAALIDPDVSSAVARLTDLIREHGRWVDAPEPVPAA